MQLSPESRPTKKLLNVTEYSYMSSQSTINAVLQLNTFE